MCDRREAVHVPTADCPTLAASRASGLGPSAPPRWARRPAAETFVRERRPVSRRFEGPHAAPRGQRAGLTVVSFSDGLTLARGSRAKGSIPPTCQCQVSRPAGDKSG